MKLILKILLGGIALFFLSFFVFLYKAGKIPEDVWREHEATVQHHYQSLAELNLAAKASITSSPEEMACAPELFQQNRVLSPLYGPYLNRFSTKDSEEWGKDYSAWSWLVPEIFYEETDAYKKMASTSITKAMDSLSQLVAVFLPENEESNHLPYAPNPEKFPTVEELTAPTKRTLARNKEANLFIDGYRTFATGLFNGWLIIVDKQSKEVICRGKLRIVSGEMVDYEYRHRSRSYSPRLALRDDFFNQFEKEIATILPEGVTVNMGKPHISVAY